MRRRCRSSTRACWNSPLSMVCSSLAKSHRANLLAGFRNAWLNSMLYGVAQSINFCVNAVVFVYGGHLIAYENYSISDFMTVFVVSPQSCWSLFILTKRCVPIGHCVWVVKCWTCSGIRPRRYKGRIGGPIHHVDVETTPGHRLAVNKRCAKEHNEW